VTNFVATAGNGQNGLSWINPGSDFAGTKIMFKTTGYPVSRPMERSATMERVQHNPQQPD